MASREATKKLHAALSAACPDQKDFATVPQLMEMLGLSGDSQYTTMRRRLGEMERQGVVERIAMGKWRPTGKEPVRRGEGYQKMWRAIRTAKGSFTVLEIVLLTSLERSTVYKYLGFLEDERLIKKTGQSGNTNLFGLTSAGREQLKTPYPPKDILNPYHNERAATAALCRILLMEDPDQPRVRRKIQEQLAILNTRFIKGAEHVEQQN